MRPQRLEEGAPFDLGEVFPLACVVDELNHLS